MASISYADSSANGSLTPAVGGPLSLRWVMIGLVFLATVVNYLDRQTLSIVAPVLIDQFHMSNTDYSRVLFGFMLAYTIANGISGPLIDRLGTKLGYGLFVVWWSVASALHALARGTFSLGVFRFLLGIGEAGNWPGGVKVVAEWFPAGERALASGIFNSGSAVGAVLAPPLVAWLVLAFGWPSAFVMVGASGFVWVVLWAFIYRSPRVAAPGPKTPRPPSTLRLLGTRWIWIFMLSKMVMDPVWYFYIFWFPQYLKSARGFDLAAIGKYAWIPFFCAGVGNLLGGLMSAGLLKLGASISFARKFTYAFFACLMTAAIPAVLAPNARLSIAFVSLATLGYTGAVANQLAMPADVFPSQVVASIWGLAGLGTGFGGMLFSLLTGWAIDRYSYTPVFIAYGVLPLLSAAVTCALLGPLRPGAAGIPVGPGESVA
jgi:ACS family hexuronate transporter-like MFS transporter